MATRGWGGSAVVALGVAAATAAAALGLGYGLGIVAWPTTTDTAGESAWLASLTWTTWIAASAAVLGAVVTDRLAGSAPPRRAPVEHDGVYLRRLPGALTTGAWRLVIAVAAAIGALLTVPLVAVPARAAHRPDTYSPQFVAGGHAIVGVAFGLVIAFLALSSRALSTNVLLYSSWLWVLAIASVVHGVATGMDTSTAQLAVWRFGGAHLINGAISLPGGVLMLGATLALGALATVPAIRRGDNRVGVAVSGAVGPLLVAVAYFLAAPKMTTVRIDDQLSAYLVAPYAVISGLAGSAVVCALVAYREQRAAAGAASARDAAGGPDRAEGSGIGGPGTTEGLGRDLDGDRDGDEERVYPDGSPATRES